MPYHSLEEILNNEEAIHNTADWLGGDYEFGTHTAGKLACSAEHIQNTQAELEKLGFDKFELLSRGRSALVLRTETGQIIRLDATTEKTELERPQIKQVLQNDASSIIDGPGKNKIHIEVLENAPSLVSLIKNGTLTKEEANNLAEKIEVGLNKDGLVPAGEIGNSQTGYRFDNIGLKNDGTPVIIDPDINISTIDQARKINENAKNLGYLPLLQKEIENFERNQAKDPVFDWKSEEIKIERNNASKIASEVANTARLAQEAEDALKAARMAKLGKLGIVTGVAITGGVDYLISDAMDKQKELAEIYYKNGDISKEAFEDYLEMNDELKDMMRIENAGAQGWTFLATTPLLEKELYDRFQEFSDKHNLPPEAHDALAMGAFKGESMQGKIYENIYEQIDVNTKDTPESLENLKTLKQEIQALEQRKSNKSFYNTGGPNIDRVMGRDNLDEQIAEKKAEFQTELSSVLKDPETAKEFVKSLPDETLKEIVIDTAQYSDSDSSIVKVIGYRLEDIDKIGNGEGMKGGAALTTLQKNEIREDIDNLIHVSLETPQLREELINYTANLITRSEANPHDLNPSQNIEEEISLNDLGFSENDLSNGSGDVSAFTDTQNSHIIVEENPANVQTLKV